jgi:hypothetical protein
MYLAGPKHATVVSWCFYTGSSHAGLGLSSAFFCASSGPIRSLKLCHQTPAWMRNLEQLSLMARTNGSLSVVYYITNSNLNDLAHDRYKLSLSKTDSQL